MDDEPQTVCLRYYGISPWEIEVIYNLFNGKFSIIQEETEQNKESFVSALTIDIPLGFFGKTDVASNLEKLLLLRV